MLLRPLPPASRHVDPSTWAGLWRMPLDRPARLSAAAVLLAGIGLPLLANFKTGDIGFLLWLLGGALLGLLLLVGWRWTAPRRPSGAVQAPADAVALGPLFDRACRQQQRRLRAHEGRLHGHADAGARSLQLPSAQARLLRLVLDAAVQLLSVDAAEESASGPIVRIDLDRLDGETGVHLRLCLVGVALPVRPRCARLLRQLSTRLGAQLDIVQDVDAVRVEVVLAVAPDQAEA
jgi:hypothetical protein